MGLNWPKAMCNTEGSNVINIQIAFWNSHIAAINVLKQEQATQNEPTDGFLQDEAVILFYFIAIQFGRYWLYVISICSVISFYLLYTRI